MSSIVKVERFFGSTNSRAVHIIDAAGYHPEERIRAFCDEIERGHADTRALLITCGALAIAAATSLDAASSGRAGRPAPSGMLDQPDQAEGNVEQGGGHD